MILNRKTVNIILALLFVLPFFSCSSASKSETQKEADRMAQRWWDTSFAKCGDSFYTSAKSIELPVDSPAGSVNIQVPLIGDALFQFKSAAFNVVEQPLTGADKLNGIEWHGKVSLPPKNTFRYYDYQKGEWSSWREGSMSMSGRNFRKEKGEWIGISEDKNDIHGLIKPDCSEIPKG